MVEVLKSLKQVDWCYVGLVGRFRDLRVAVIGLIDSSYNVRE